MRKPDPLQRSGNWYLFSFYFNQKDPRIIVPKRISSMGWTINFARPMAIPALLLMTAILLAPFKIIDRLEIHSNQARGLIIIIEIIGLIAFCSWRADPGDQGRQALPGGHLVWRHLGDQGREIPRLAFVECHGGRARQHGTQTPAAHGRTL